MRKGDIALCIIVVVALSSAAFVGVNGYKANQAATEPPSADSPTPAPTETPGPPDDVIEDAEVIDGDTIHAEYRGSEEEIRLLGIDTPETTQAPAPEEWEGVTSHRCLREHGIEAKQELAAYFEEDSRFVTLETDPESDRRGYYDRLLGYVQVGETNVNYWLVANGYARYYESDFSQSERFQQAEINARANELGAWSCN